MITTVKWRNKHMQMKDHLSDTVSRLSAEQAVRDERITGYIRTVLCVGSALIIGILIGVFTTAPKENDPKMVEIAPTIFVPSTIFKQGSAPKAPCPDRFC